MRQLLLCCILTLLVAVCGKPKQQQQHSSESESGEYYYVYYYEGTTEEPEVTTEFYDEETTTEDDEWTTEFYETTEDPTTPKPRPFPSKHSYRRINPTNCGRNSLRASNTHRIAGGNEAKPHEWPWAVSLQIRDGFRSYSHSCGAALINELWVVTAAHCLPTQRSALSRYRLLLGAHHLYRHSPSVQRRFISKAFRHPKYVKDDFDIALIKMDRPVSFNRQINSVCLANNLQNEPQTGEVCVVTGWGATHNSAGSSVLREVRLPIISRTQCSRRWESVISLDSLCAFKPGADSCSGDSGGSLVCKHNNRWYSGGIVSWGSADCNSMPGVYTSVRSVIPWIRDVVARN